MQIVLQSTGHAKSLAKSLCRSLAAEGREIKLTAAQAAVARMFDETGLPAVLAEIRALTCRVDSPDWRPVEDLVAALIDRGMDEDEAQAATRRLVDDHCVDGNTGEPVEGLRVVRMRTKIMIMARDMETAIAQAFDAALAPAV